MYEQVDILLNILKLVTEGKNTIIHTIKQYDSESESTVYDVPADKISDTAWMFDDGMIDKALPTIEGVGPTWVSRNVIRDITALFLKIDTYKIYDIITIYDKTKSINHSTKI